MKIRLLNQEQGMRKLRDNRIKELGEEMKKMEDQLKEEEKKVKTAAAAATAVTAAADQQQAKVGVEITRRAVTCVIGARDGIYSDGSSSSRYEGC